MRRLAALLAIIALLAAPAAALAQEEFTAQLTHEEEPEVNVPDGFEGEGMATVTISDDATEVDYEVTFQNLTGPLVGAHIHWDPPGQPAGPVILPFEHGESPFSGTLTEADFTPAEGGPQTFEEALDAIRAGDTYVNLHTEMNAPGEIRGQLRGLVDTATGDQAGSTGAWLGLLVLALAGAAFVVTYRRFAARPA